MRAHNALWTCFFSRLLLARSMPERVKEFVCHPRGAQPSERWWNILRSGVRRISLRPPRRTTSASLVPFHLHALIALLVLLATLPAFDILHWDAAANRDRTPDFAFAIHKRSGVPVTAGNRMGSGLVAVCAFTPIGAAPPSAFSLCVCVWSASQSAPLTSRLI